MLNYDKSIKDVILGDKKTFNVSIAGSGGFNEQGQNNNYVFVHETSWIEKEKIQEVEAWGADKNIGVTIDRDASFFSAPDNHGILWYPRRLKHIEINLKFKDIVITQKELQRLITSIKEKQRPKKLLYQNTIFTNQRFKNSKQKNKQPNTNTPASNLEPIWENAYRSKRMLGKFLVSASKAFWEHSSIDNKEAKLPADFEELTKWLLLTPKSDDSWITTITGYKVQIETTGFNIDNNIKKITFENKTIKRSLNNILTELRD